ncbi:MAG: GTP cyclohydrolase II [Methanobacteriota archaeon]|nr:MAG: GTP cyclohydrolase II [Euryarchaeota archaeon]
MDNGKMPGDGLKIYGEAKLPSRFGNFKIYSFKGTPDGKDHIAVVAGDVQGKEDVLTRVHSECLTGDVFGSLRCDCREQLELALDRLRQEGEGVIIYHRQEGRGIGLANKIKAYELQDQGYNTIEANEKLGFKADQRDYAVVPLILEALGVKSIRLMTNNPAKLSALRRLGVKITGRVDHHVDPNEYNEFYLETKRVKMGHWL